MWTVLFYLLQLYYLKDELLKVTYMLMLVVCSCTYILCMVLLNVYLHECLKGLVPDVSVSFGILHPREFGTPNKFL